MTTMRATGLGLLLALLTAPTFGQDALMGDYDIEGRTEGGVAYVGSATVRWTAHGAQMIVRRAGDPELRGFLHERNGEWTMKARLDALGGMTSALEGAGQARNDTVREYRYRKRGERLLCRWRERVGDEIFERGRERLTRSRPTPPAVRIAVSVDWEGRALEDRNLEAMEAFRDALPGVPLTHFLNAAYFTKPNADVAAIVSGIKRVVWPIDETGLHVHGWRSLIEASGVTFRSTPSFWGENRPLRPVGGDMGHEVEIAAYTVQELRDVFARSKTILARAGYPLSASFRAGGWMATPNVLGAIRAEGFRVDTSATDNAWHDELAGVRLRARIKEVWPQTTRTSAPWWIETPAGRVLEMPDTGALADYVTADEMVAHIENAITRFSGDPSRDVYVHIGFHQETAARYAYRVSDAIEHLRRSHPDAPLVYETLEASAARATRGLASSD